jgi:hypothetical protein
MSVARGERGAGLGCGAARLASVIEQVDLVPFLVMMRCRFFVYTEAWGTHLLLLAGCGRRRRQKTFIVTRHGGGGERKKARSRVGGRA